MRPLNLIPPEERRGDSAPLRAGVLSYVVVGVLAAALLAVVALVLTSNKINDDKSELASLEARSAVAEQTASSLAPYDNFASLTATRSLTVTSLAQSRFDWERVLQELALVIPDDVTLENLSGAATPASGATTTTTGDSSAVTGPSLQLSGCAEGQEGVARLLAALRDIDGVTRVGMQSSALADADTGTAGSATASVGGSGCEVKPDAATFEITVAFDAVPAPAAAATTAVPATDTTTAPATPAATPTSDTTSQSTDGGVAQTETQQQGAVDSANNQTRKARNSADAVGEGQ
jgi:Tfp pilus assembly protein PilN